MKVGGTSTKEEQTNTELIREAVECAAVYVEAGMDSDYYQEARRHLEAEEAARVTILFLYLSTFPKAERERISRNVYIFLRYAGAMHRELFQQFLSRDYADSTRPLLRKRLAQSLRTMRRRAGRPHPGEGARIMRAAIALGLSVDEMVEAYDRYREYMFRIYPQMHQAVAC